MKIIICKWGILKFAAILSQFVKWEFFVSAIDSEPYIISKWLFTSMPKMFPSSYVLFIENGVKNKQDVKKLVKKLEQVEGITLTKEKKEEIYQAAENLNLFSLVEEELYTVIDAE